MGAAIQFRSVYESSLFTMFVYYVFACSRSDLIENSAFIFAVSLRIDSLQRATLFLCPAEQIQVFLM